MQRVKWQENPETCRAQQFTCIPPKTRLFFHYILLVCILHAKLVTASSTKECSLQWSNLCCWWKSVLKRYVINLLRTRFFSSFQGLTIDIWSSKDLRSSFIQAENLEIMCLEGLQWRLGPIFYYWIIKISHLKEKQRKRKGYSPSWPAGMLSKSPRIPRKVQHQQAKAVTGFVGSNGASGCLFSGMSTWNCRQHVMRMHSRIAFTIYLLHISKRVHTHELYSLMPCIVMTA